MTSTKGVVRSLTKRLKMCFVYFFRITVVKKAFDAATSTTKLSLCTTYNPLSV